MQIYFLLDLDGVNVNNNINLTDIRYQLEIINRDIICIVCMTTSI